MLPKINNKPGFNVTVQIQFMDFETLWNHYTFKDVQLTSFTTAKMLAVNVTMWQLIDDV